MGADLVSHEICRQEFTLDKFVSFPSYQILKFIVVFG